MAAVEDTAGAVTSDQARGTATAAVRPEMPGTREIQGTRTRTVGTAGAAAVAAAAAVAVAPGAGVEGALVHDRTIVADR